MKIVYGAKTCHKCNALTKKYDEEKVEYKYIDVAVLTPKELSDIAKTSDSLSLPIVIER